MRCASREFRLCCQVHAVEFRSPRSGWEMREIINFFFGVHPWPLGICRWLTFVLLANAAAGWISAATRPTLIKVMHTGTRALWFRIQLPRLDRSGTGDSRPVRVPGPAGTEVTTPSDANHGLLLYVPI